MKYSFDSMARSAALAAAATCCALGLSCGDEGSTAGGTTTTVGGSSMGGYHGGGSGGTGGSGGSGATGGAGGGPISCTGGGLVSGEQSYDIDFDGKTRSYTVQVPVSYDGGTAVPLVLDFHGYMSNGGQQKLVSGMSDKAEAEGFILVRPEGYGVLQSWNGGHWCCGDAQAEGLDDVGLAKAIVAEVSAAACIDPHRVYATGISNGGALSHRIGCEAADVFAAVAPVSYPLDIEPMSDCQPSRPISVMHFHGTNDLLVPYDGGANMAATPDSFAYWAQADGCTDSPAVSYSKGNSKCETHSSCDEGVEVTLCSIDGGHVLYTNADDVPIADLAWQFFSQHTLP